MFIGCYDSNRFTGFMITVQIMVHCRVILTNSSSHLRSRCFSEAILRVEFSPHYVVAPSLHQVGVGSPAQSRRSGASPWGHDVGDPPHRRERAGASRLATLWKPSKQPNYEALLKRQLYYRGIPSLPVMMFELQSAAAYIPLPRR